MDRRTFLRTSLGAGAAAVSVPTLGRVVDPGSAASSNMRRRASPRSVLESRAADCPIDTIVVVMMENRSFDHYFGWLGDDVAYIEAGRRRYGRDFSVDGSVNQTFTDASGNRVVTRSAETFERENLETRSCTFGGPGHTRDQARAQRDHGFLAPGTGSDDLAVTYYTGQTLPFYEALVRRFTVFDRWHSSLLGPTFPNRQYLLSAQSEGRMTNPSVLRAPVGVFGADTIVDRLAAAGVSVGYYFTNAPLLALWGLDRMTPYIRPLDRYFEDASTGNLPGVAFVEPHFGGDTHRTDDHPHGDVELGQRWVREIFGAFANSAHWARGAFVLTYDEGGGFFDHVPPPSLPDARASSNDRRNFGQAGFRVPALLASPFAQPSAVDHRLYDHTSILRFLEWRFLGAPPEGPDHRRRWALTRRDAMAHNMGRTLRASRSDPELRFDLGLRIPQPAGGCTPVRNAAPSPAPTEEPDPFEHPELADLGATFPATTHRPWLADVTVPLN